MITLYTHTYYDLNFTNALTALTFQQFLEEIVNKGTFVRDYGTRQEKILLANNKGI
jgi:hypothetical protein